MDKTKNITWWSLTQKALVKALRLYVIMWESQVHFKGDSTIKDLLMAPKDKDSITSKGGVIYRYRCDHPGCTEEYIGETGRTYGDRYKEHLRAPSPIYGHANTTGHSIQLDSFSIVDRESQGIARP